MTTAPLTPGTGPEADHWFVAHGLPWFVPERRAAAQRALHSRRTLVGMAVIAVLALGVGVALAFLTDTASLAPATLVTVVLLAATAYAGRELGAWPIARWAFGRTMRSLHLLVPMVTRALPLLLLFITFLFINTEVWQVASTLDGGVLWVTVLMFAGLATGFLLVRLPEEMDHVDDEVETSAMVSVCRGTPMAAYAEQLAARHGHDHRMTEDTQIHGLEKANLVLVLMVAQAVQVLLLAVSVFAFFVVFGAVVMDHGVQEIWVGQGQVHALPWADNLSVELLQVSVFLAAFSGLYFTVYAVTDETYRDQFFTEVKGELDRAVGVRAVYLAARATSQTG